MRSLLHRFRARSPVSSPAQPLPPHPFDLAHGTDTGGLIPPEQLRTWRPQSQHTTAYYAMSPSRFRAAIDLWLATPSTHPIEEYTFFDLGCGKGRALLLATELPFRQAIGIELHRGLARIARQNLALWQAAGRTRCPARVLRADATRLALPPGPCLLYLFHPFTAAAMARLITRLSTAVRKRPPATLDIIYFNPEAAELWTQEPGVHQLWSKILPMSPEDAAADPIANPDDRCNAYRWHPNHPPPPSPRAQPKPRIQP